MNTEQEKGFSLIESLIVISIIAIMSALSLKAIPVARSQQQLISDTEQIRALLLDAKERALNQVRPAGCIPNAANPGDATRAPCSDVGIAFVGNHVIEFADTTQDNVYTSVGTKDYTIASFTLSATPGGASVASLLFKAVPPSVLLYTGGTVQTASATATILTPSTNATILLNGYGALSRTLVVHSYGTIDVQ